MRPAIHRICDGLCWCGATLLVTLAIPVLALSILVLRTVFVAVAGVVVLGAIGLFCVHSPFRTWLAGHAQH